ncbi:hypothetical protein [Microbacterium sp. NPDC077184]|uniref:hypothetical protein n=1 Tax=Microbacterium sp. NPDC077184 TaxID=3154764 RepID=UPI00343FF3D7
MEPLFDFLGNFWWLAFPLFGVGAGAWNALQAASRRRHKQKLELIRARAELRAAETGVILPPLAAKPEKKNTNESEGTSGEKRPTTLERLFATHDDITARWLDYELDVAKMIAYPAMSDGRQPLTAAFLRAKRRADHLRPDGLDARISAEELREYREAVTEFEVAFDLAERDARRLRDSEFTDAERKRLATAQRLLNIAVDEAATPAERQSAYRRVREELDGLIAVSDEAMETLEKKVMRELPRADDPKAARP